MASSRIELKSAVTFENQKPVKIMEVDESFLKSSNAKLDLLKSDMEEFFGLITISLFKDDPLNIQFSMITKLLVSASSYMDSSDPYNTYFRAIQRTEQSIINQIATGLNELYQALKQRAARVEKAGAIEAKVFPFYPFPKSYYNIEKESDPNPIEKAIAIFQDYNNYPKLHFHRRSHCKSAEYLSTHMIIISGKICDVEEAKKTVCNLIQKIKNNLIGRGDIVVNEKHMNSSFLRRMHFVTDNLLQLESAKKFEYESFNRRSAI